MLLQAVEHTTDSVFITDPEGTIIYANPAFERVTGYAKEEVIGRNPRILRSGQHPRSFYTQMFRELQAGRPFRALFANVTKQGDISYEDKTITPIRNAAGEISHFVSTGSDITEVRKSRDLELKLKAAEEAERFKTNLLSTISHELRTPLSAIMTYTTAILEYREALGPERVTEYLQNIEKRSLQLERLIADLLTMSRLESGNLPMEYETVLIWDVIADAVEDWRMRGTLAVEYAPPKRRLHARIDVIRIREVVQNLVENAEKYGGPNGKVSISVEFRQPDRIEITVRDHGAGVPADKLDTIFDRFYRRKTRGKSTVPGTGLGLAICKGIVEAHGGNINAHIPAGGGLAVSFTVPCARAHKALNSA